jgi:hypothetical protein
MKGDLSRSTFRPDNHYSGVRLQQGRVLLDAEWNEQADIWGHRQRTTDGDVIGETGAPKHPPSDHVHFAVGLGENGADLSFGPGRMYVDGILCETTGTTFLGQPDLPGATLPQNNGPAAVYLDVWERHITPVEQQAHDFADLREVALGGPDTATRGQVVWQAKLQSIDTKSCSAFVAPPPSTGQLRARAVPAADPGNDCLVPEAGGYRRLENQLYRVEVVTTTTNGVDVTWSRDNGSVVSRVGDIDATAHVITVEDEDKDDTHGFATAKYVELSDDERWRRNERGVVLEVQSVTGTAITFSNPDNLNLAVGANPTLRRWDGRLTLISSTPVELEDGVEVEIDGGTLAPTDYWVIAARTLSGDVEWPTDASTPSEPIFEPPHGVRHHYAVLAVVDFDGKAFAAPVDCRPLFPPLTAIAASDVSYDPAACNNLATATTVQEAIDILCKAGGNQDEPAIHVEKITFVNGEPLRNDIPVKAESLASGILISCDRQLFQDSVRNPAGLPNPVCRVTIDLPWPTNPTDRDLWKVQASGFIGFVTLTLAADVNADNSDILWRPIEKAPNLVQSWLTGTMLNAVVTSTHGQITRVLCRLRLKGNFIWGPDSKPDLYLDGDTFGFPGDQHVDIVLPSGNGRRGGDFEMWFWVA